MIKSKATWLLAVAVSASIPTTRVFAYEPPTRASLNQQPSAVQKEKLPSRDLFAQNKPVSPNALPPSDEMVWRVNWISTNEKDFKDQLKNYEDAGWEPFAMTTFPKTETRDGGDSRINVYHYVFAYRKKFPKGS